MLSDGRHKGGLSEVAASRYGPKVTHLLFADDSLLFGLANKSEGETIKGILRDYENSSSQKINFEKSSILFNSNTVQARRDEMKQLLGVSEQGNMEKYLGLPRWWDETRRQCFEQFWIALSNSGWN